MESLGEVLPRYGYVSDADWLAMLAEARTRRDKLHPKGSKGRKDCLRDEAGRPLARPNTDHLCGWEHWHLGGSLETAAPQAKRKFVQMCREHVLSSWGPPCSGTPSKDNRITARCTDHDLPGDKPYKDPFPPMEDDEDAWLY